MEDQLVRDDAVSRRALWFGLLGGAVAWVAHLLLAYAIAEWGCVSNLTDPVVLGITGTALLLILATVVTVLPACAAVFVAYRSERLLRRQDPEGGGWRGPDRYMARAGLLMSGLFVFIILVESLPIFFFLESC